jgi:hypothetical protein
MTYNFDPDRWFDNEKAYLELRRRNGQLTEAAFREALAVLQQRYDEMWKRLDGGYRVDPKRS